MVDSLSIGVPILAGVVIGALEAFFVYEDENMTNVKQAFSDMIHGFFFAAIGTLIACNVPYVLSLVPLPGFVETILFMGSNGISITICIIITIFMILKMTTSHAIKGVSSNGFTEKFWHKLFVAALVGFSPYYILPLSSYLSQFVPSWIPL